MKDEIKEILEYAKSKGYIDLDYDESKILLDYITNLQEQLHQASLDIQELTEKDIGCPSWCDKLTNLQEERKTLYRYTPEKGFRLVGDEDVKD